jgi:hypothetical protein
VLNLNLQEEVTGKAALQEGVEQQLHQAFEMIASGSSGSLW